MSVGQPAWNTHTSLASQPCAEENGEGERVFQTSRIFRVRGEERGRGGATLPLPRCPPRTGKIRLVCEATLTQVFGMRIVRAWECYSLVRDVDA